VRWRAASGRVTLPTGVPPITGWFGAVAVTHDRREGMRGCTRENDGDCEFRAKLPMWWYGLVG
jgi:hypothetical protein